MLAATGCIRAQVGPLGEKTLELETFRFDTKITDLYPEKNLNTFYVNGDVYNFPGTEEAFFERKREINGYKITEDDIEEEVVVYHQITYPYELVIARFGEMPFNDVSVMTTADDRIAAISATAHAVEKDRSDELVAYLTERYGTPTRMESSWDRRDGAPLYEWITETRIIRYVYAVDHQTILHVDPERMQISQEESGKTCDAHIFIINPELREVVFPGDKNCTVSGNFVHINEEKEIVYQVRQE